MNTENSPLRVLSPVDQLPAEGFDLPESDCDDSLLDLYVAALAESQVGFILSEDGVAPAPGSRGGDVFQRFEVRRATADSRPRFEPGDDAFEIDFEGIFDGSVSWDDLNDASEPRDFVRRFLATLGPALDAESEIDFQGRHVPLLRWQPRSNGPGARVQLLGILQTDDAGFEEFCRENADDFTFILEDDEVEARGLREIVTSLAILGVSLAVAPRADAGLFDKLFSSSAATESAVPESNETHAKAKSARERAAERRNARRTKAKVVQSPAGWIDTHNDARIDQKHLQATANADVDRQIVVDIGKQRAYLVIDGKIAVDTAISTARSEKYTPRGDFKITERVRTGKTSTLYGCEMPYWMRLDESAIGMHIGDLPGYPASAGCVRLPFSVAPVIFDNTRSGTTVHVVDSWDQSAQSAAVMIARAN